MTRDIPKLTDRPALDLHRARAEKCGNEALFLHKLAFDECQERLSLVNRAFTSPRLITGHPSIWDGLFGPEATLPDTAHLPLAKNAHDLIVHAMALHWADDPVGQLIQARRALQPDGHFVACCFGGDTLQELRAVLAQTESELTGGLSPRVLPMGDIRQLGGLLQRAGFALPVADIVTQTVTYSDLPALIRDLRAMGETNALAQRHKAPLPRDFLERASTLYQDNFAAEGGRILATFEILFLSGWAPHPDQQQPLRPGSATHALADALASARSSDSKD